MAIDIQKLAQLSRIAIPEDSEAQYEREITDILGYVDRVQEAVTDDMKSAQRVEGSVRNVGREDTDPHEAGVHTEDIVGEMPDTHDGYLKVKKIL